MNPEIQEIAERMTDDILKALGKKNDLMTPFIKEYIQTNLELCLLKTL